MKDINKILLTIGLGLILISSVLFVKLQPDSEQPIIMGAGLSSITDSFSDGVEHKRRVEVSTTATTSLDRNTRRIFARIINDGTTKVYLFASSSVEAATSSLATNGTPLNPNDQIEFNATEAYLGAIQAVVLTGTTSLTIMEVTKK